MRHVSLAVLVAGTLQLAAVSAAASDCDWLTAGVAYGAPGKLGAFLDGGCTLGRKEHWGLVFGGQLGTGAGDLSAGLTRAVGGASTVNLRAVLMRTWSGSGVPAGGTTLIGGRLEYSVLGGMLSLNGGALVPTAGAARENVRFTWGVGVGIPLWLLKWEGIGRIEV